MSKNFDFEMSQALLRSHCDRKGHEHECVGEVTVKRGKVCLNCQLCGSGDQIPGWCSSTDEYCRRLFAAAGIDWDSIDFEARLRAIRKAQEKTNV